MASSRRPRGRLAALTESSLFALCGGAMALNLLLVTGVLALIAVRGGAYFWQRDLVLVRTSAGDVHLGEVHDREPRPVSEWADPAHPDHRIQLDVGNRDLGGADFVWIDESDVVERRAPAEALALERLEWGAFHGYLREIRAGERLLADGDEAWRMLERLLPQKAELRDAITHLERRQIGDLNWELDRLRLARRRLELESASSTPAEDAALAQQTAQLETRYEALSSRLFAMREELLAETVVVETAGGTLHALPLGTVIRALRPNQMSTPAKLVLYASRVREFLTGNPRESNTEGGIFPAIFGTVMMVFLMTAVVTPLGVLAALYLREYARQGALVRVVRIAVNNLAGVPSIVFGVFGLGFFVYLIGGSLDRLFYREALPTPTLGTGGILWASLTLALLTVPVVIVATEEGLAAVPRSVREGSLALGATKLETLWRVVLPAAGPGILTGMILAMARAAGEVAPLMIVGMVKLAPTLPVDHHFPFLHLERKFMHLGFHIYDVGFQSPNVEATKPLVFATALLLIAIVTVMNLAAIALRNHLRAKYRSAAV
jgi:phosphate transport system permease protein